MGSGGGEEVRISGEGLDRQWKGAGHLIRGPSRESTVGVEAMAGDPKGEDAGQSMGCWESRFWS